MFKKTVGISSVVASLCATVVCSPSSAIATSMVNPGFEDGLNGWTVTGESGNVYATASYSGVQGQNYTAPSGAKFAVVNAGCPANTLVQNFSAKAGEVLMGWSFFRANDYTPFDDTGVVKLVILSNNTQTTLFASKVSDVGDYGGTGWIPWSFTFPADGTYSIQAISTNVLDCGLDSVVGLDIAAPSDTDSDGILDSADNCPAVANPDQLNTDGDAEGDACDTDDDNDTVLDTSDNCPLIVNADQADNDGDGQGDICDADDDNDGVADGSDNCAFTANSDQKDTDGDGQGDVCDGDQDGDGVANEVDNCPAAANADQADNDSDGSGDACDLDDDNDGVADDQPDNCPLAANADQADLDGDKIGDACDIDIDGDGVENADDNCELLANAAQEDTDFDGAGDACDDDDDNDTVLDAADNCSLIVNADQSDIDGDGQGDVCDGDLDGDGQANETDNCPNVANASQNDFDSDGKGDACDEDVDGDDVPNDNDMCAFTPLDAIFSPEGCSINQLCPCEGPRGTTELWKNHGQYVSCIVTSVNSFFEAKLITNADRRNVLRDAARSFCGKQAWKAVERRKQ